MKIKIKELVEWVQKYDANAKNPYKGHVKVKYSDIHKDMKHEEGKSNYDKIMNHPKLKHIIHSVAEDKDGAYLSSKTHSNSEILAALK